MRRQAQPILPLVEEIDPVLKLAVTPDEAAERLSIGRTLFYELLHAGAIKGVRVNTKTIIPVAEIQAFLDRNLGAEIKLTA